MSTISFSHAEHEARHICAAWFCNLDVESAAVGIHAPAEGIAHMPAGENGAADLLVRVVGWLDDPDRPPGALWPPPYPPPADHDVDGLAWCVRRYGLSREGYEAVCKLAQELLEEEDFREAVRLVARALYIAPRIDAAGLEVLRRATVFANEVAA